MILSLLGQYNPMYICIAKGCIKFFDLTLFRRLIIGASVLGEFSEHLNMFAAVHRITINYPTLDL